MVVGLVFLLAQASNLIRWRVVFWLRLFQLVYVLFFFVVVVRSIVFLGIFGFLLFRCDRNGYVPRGGHSYCWCGLVFVFLCVVRDGRHRRRRNHHDDRGGDDLDACTRFEEAKNQHQPFRQTG